MSLILELSQEKLSQECMSCYSAFLGSTLVTGLEIKDLTRHTESDKDGFYFFFLSNCCDMDFQHYVEKEGARPGILCLISNLGEKALTFSQLSKIIAVGLSYAAFIMLK